MRNIGDGRVSASRYDSSKIGAVTTVSTEPRAGNEARSSKSIIEVRASFNLFSVRLWGLRCLIRLRGREVNDIESSTSSEAVITLLSTRRKLKLRRRSCGINECHMRISRTKRRKTSIRNNGKRGRNNKANFEGRRKSLRTRVDQGKVAERFCDPKMAKNMQHLDTRSGERNIAKSVSASGAGS
jgi:hypothetical protein